jgi:hypothetical protein
LGVIECSGGALLCACRKFKDFAHGGVIGIGGGQRAQLFEQRLAAGKIVLRLGVGAPVEQCGGKN